MEKTIDIHDELAAELASLEAIQMRRSPPTIEMTEGSHVTINGQSLINFSSNNYLGLARHPQVIESIRQVIDHWGAGATSSRLISGSTIIHQDLEQALAAFMRTEAALVFPTGYMANLGVITALVGEGDAIIMDRLCHASLIDGARLSGARLFVYGHGDVQDAERVLTRAESYKRKLLISDSLFSMDGDFAPVDALARVASRYGAISLLDEAHAIGVWGEGGRGARFDTETRGHGDTGKKQEGFSASPRLRVSASSDWDVIVGTLSKALGAQGGFICGSRALIDTLLNKARSFIYTTGLSPINVAAAHAALSLIQEDAAPRERLQKLSHRLREGLRDLGFDILGSESQIVPILLGSVEKALACSTYLEASGIFAPAIRPPTVHAGQCRIRFSVTADHANEDIDKLLAVLAGFPDRHPPRSLAGDPSALLRHSPRTSAGNPSKRNDGSSASTRRG
jgi:8-amino-7-oxononanoate synthase